MSPFIYRDGAYRAKWDTFEVAVFAAIIGGVIETLTDDAYDDPARAKLLPVFSRDDAVDVEFSRLIGRQIEDAKLRVLQKFGALLISSLPDAEPSVTQQSGISQLDHVNQLDTANQFDNSQFSNASRVELVITPDNAQSVLQALTAIRVYLGEKLHIETDEDSEILYQLMERAAEQVVAENPESEPDAASASSQSALDQQVFLASVFSAAGFAQETLVTALMERMAP